MSQVDASTSEKPQRTKRRWLQFTLRTLLIFMTLFAVSFGWWSYKARQQRALVKLLRRPDVMISYDIESYDGSGKRCAYRGYAPLWLVNFLGIDYFANVDNVWLFNGNDADLQRITGFTQLTRLTVLGSETTDRGVSHIATLRYLTNLSIQGQKVSDQGLANLGSLTELKSLIHRDTQITDAGVVRLKQLLPQCKIIQLPSAHVDERGSAGEIP
jgi:hypothetical protein